MNDRVIAVILCTKKRYDQALAIRDDVTSRLDVPTIVYCDAKSEGAARATQAAIATASTLFPGKWVLFLEDDVQLLPTAEFWFAELMRELDSYSHRFSVISLCDMREMSEGAWTVDGNGCFAGVVGKSPLGCEGIGWWGNQAMLVEPGTAAYLSEADWFAPDVEAFPGVAAHRAAYQDEGRNCSDIRMSYLVSKWPNGPQMYAVHVPSLFNHVGVHSECFPGRQKSLGHTQTRNLCTNYGYRVIGDLRHWNRFFIQKVSRKQPILEDSAIADARNPFGADYGKVYLTPC